MSPAVPQGDFLTGCMVWCSEVEEQQVKHVGVILILTDQNPPGNELTFLDLMSQTVVQEGEIATHTTQILLLDPLNQIVV